MLSRALFGIAAGDKPFAVNAWIMQTAFMPSSAEGQSGPQTSCANAPLGIHCIERSKAMIENPASSAILRSNEERHRFGASELVKRYFEI
jgi:hypothetical protein